jgi:hypothetical protein
VFGKGIEGTIVVVDDMPDLLPTFFSSRGPHVFVDVDLRLSCDELADIVRDSSERLVVEWLRGLAVEPELSVRSIAAGGDFN